MTVISIKTENSADSPRIELSDGSIFSYKMCYLPGSPDIFAGAEINSTEEENLRFASACLRAEKAALQLIARAEQTVWGLSRKLEKRGHNPACIRAVIAQIGELGLVDDCRYARLWLESRLSRPSSPRRLLAALRNRGIDRHDAEAALKTVLDDEAELQLLERYVQKLLRKQKSSGDSDNRALRYTLKNEGFSSAAIKLFFED